MKISFKLELYELTFKLFLKIAMLYCINVVSASEYGSSVFETNVNVPMFNIKIMCSYMIRIFV